MKGAPWFKFFPETFLGTTSEWSHEETGIYIEALSHAWNGRGIPSDRRDLARLLRLTPQKLRKVWPKLSQKFDVVLGEKLSNSFLENLRFDAEEKSEKAQQSAHARWSKKHADADANAQELDANAHALAHARLEVRGKSKRKTPTASKEKHAAAAVPLDGEVDEKRRLLEAEGFTDYQVSELMAATLGTIQNQLAWIERRHPEKRLAMLYKSIKENWPEPNKSRVEELAATGRPAGLVLPDGYEIPTVTEQTQLSEARYEV